MKHPDISLEVGKNEIDSGHFYYKNGLTTYEVAYRYAGDGVIAYDYRISEYDYQTALSTAFVVGAAVAVGVIAAGLPGGALAFLLLA